MIQIASNDDDDRAPSFSSTPPLTAVAGSAYGYDADADGRPTPSYSLTEQPAGMTIDAESGVIAWTPSETGRFAVVVRAGNGVGPAATQSFEITVAGDEAPVCSITQPLEGETVRGDRAEFYGDAIDDVRAIRAEFLADDVVVYTDVNDDGHYPFGSAHNLFDTTQYPDGPHRLSFIGYDHREQRCMASVQVTIANGNAGDAGTPPARDAGEAGASGSADAAPGDASDPGEVAEDCTCRLAGAPRPANGAVMLAAFVLLGFGVRIRRRRAERRRREALT